MSARDEILGRIRTAVVDVTEDAPDLDVPIEWTYGHPVAIDDVIVTFVERVEDYKARVIEVGPEQVADTLADELRRHGVTSVVVPPGLDEAWRTAASGVCEVLVDTPEAPLTAHDLDRVGGVITASRVGIAVPGTIVLDHDDDQGRRALSLVPDLHLCVVRADHVVSDVPEAVTVLRESVAAGRPLTWIAGPSATSDIELSRVEGVHGPRTLVVLLVR